MHIARPPAGKPRSTSSSSSHGLPAYYNVKFTDPDGAVIFEKQIFAASYSAVLRSLSEVADGATRIEVYNQSGERVGEVGVDYWQQRLRGRK